MLKLLCATLLPITLLVGCSQEAEHVQSTTTGEPEPMEAQIRATTVDDEPEIEPTFAYLFCKSDVRETVWTEVHLKVARGEGTTVVPEMSSAYSFTQYTSGGTGPDLTLHDRVRATDDTIYTVQPRTRSQQMFGGWGRYDWEIERDTLVIKKYYTGSWGDEERYHYLESEGQCELSSSVEFEAGRERFNAYQRLKEMERAEEERKRKERALENNKI